MIKLISYPLWLTSYMVDKVLHHFSLFFMFIIMAISMRFLERFNLVSFTNRLSLHNKSWIKKHLDSRNQIISKSH